MKNTPYDVRGVSVKFTVKQIDPISSLKMGLALYVLYVVVLSLLSFIVWTFQAGGPINAFFLLISLLPQTLVTAVIAAIWSGAVAFAYNFFAKRLGGITITLQPENTSVENPE
jgi:hypothetical protein